MYVIKRRERLTDKLQLVEGERTLEVPVEIDIDKAIANYWKYYENLHLAQEQLKKSDTVEAQQAFGTAFLLMLEFLFGTEWAGKMLDFYDGRHSELLIDLYPYIDGHIYPLLKKASKEKAKQARNLKRGV